jgi:CRP-like cAMP-binding protein
VTKSIYQTYNWFEDLPEEPAAAIKRVLIERAYSSGEFLYQQGDSLLHLFQLVSGNVEVCNFSRKGEQFTVGMLKAGSWCGEISITLQQPAAYSCVARGEVKARLLHRDDFRRLADEYPVINARLLVKTSYLLRLFMDRATIASRSSARERLVWLLLWM